MTASSIEKKHFYCLLKVSKQCKGRRKYVVCLGSLGARLGPGCDG